VAPGLEPSVENLLLLFLKAPVPGRVKTRLAATLGAEAAAGLYVRMARQVYQAASRLPGIQTLAAYEPAQAFPDLSWLGPHPPAFAAQEGEGLGQRLENAFRLAFSLGARRVAAIGADSPGLPAEWLSLAFAELGRNAMVLGPAEDGGYYLIGLSRFEPALFETIPWSSPQVLALTLDKARDLGLAFFLLPEYFDVDDEESLRRWERL